MTSILADYNAAQIQTCQDLRGGGAGEAGNDSPPGQTKETILLPARSERIIEGSVFMHSSLFINVVLPWVQTRRTQHASPPPRQLRGASWVRPRPAVRP